MKRRSVLKAVVASSTLPFFLPHGMAGLAWAATPGLVPSRPRVRPGDVGWPTEAGWDRLRRDVGGRLIKLDSAFAGCSSTPIDATCAETMSNLGNAFFVGDQPALTQTSGWLDAWSSRPSAYAVAANNAADVVAAVNFARRHDLRLVIKGGGHSYQGTSASPDSLLVWTRHMNAVRVQESFVAQGCAGSVPPQPAVTVDAGAMWIDAYDAVTTRGGRYVQGGGCTTVGVAGLVQSGGFGNFSKCYGTAAAGLLEAEVVTADGELRIANACTNPELFWALKGGGGGSFGVVTRMTLRTRDLPETFGAVFCEIKASSDDAYRTLIAKSIEFYRSALFNPHWGEQISFHSSNVLDISLVFQGLRKEQAELIWAPFLEWVRARKEYSFEKPFGCIAVPARHFWDAVFLGKHFPGLLITDPRAGEPAHHALWEGDQDQAGWFIHGYKSAWLPATLLQIEQQATLVDALFHCSRHWSVALHFNKGLAGAASTELDSARDTAMNPQVLGAFALAIIAGGDSAKFSGMPGTAPNLPEARANAGKIEAAMKELLKAAPEAGSYVSESDYFRSDWQTAFWGENQGRLSAVKRKYDPQGLFFVRHGVGSEEWSEDGFTRRMPG
ncbi:MAG: FAD-linked oxidoreductase [Lysobacteraceae bacterium]|nr:MAG: FAD-linked oxidoreductase [Xanthomonadaceae bacterium]